MDYCLLQVFMSFFDDVLIESLQSGQKVKVSYIAHKAVIVVDERGGEPRSEIAMPGPVLNLERPFCFFIMTRNDMVCLAGVFYDIIT